MRQGTISGIDNVGSSTPWFSMSLLLSSIDAGLQPGYKYMRIGVHHVSAYPRASYSHVSLGTRDSVHIKVPLEQAILNDSASMANVWAREHQNQPICLNWFHSNSLSNCLSELEDKWGSNAKKI